MCLHVNKSLLINVCEMFSTYLLAVRDRCRMRAPAAMILFWLGPLQKAGQCTLILPCSPLLRRWLPRPLWRLELQLETEREQMTSIRSCVRYGVLQIIGHESNPKGLFKETWLFFYTTLHPNRMTRMELNSFFFIRKLYILVFKYWKVLLLRRLETKKRRRKLPNSLDWTMKS